MSAGDAAFERAFWQALDDLKAGSEKPVEEYLRLVPRAERPQLSRLLADVLQAQGPGPAAGAAAGAGAGAGGESEGYRRAAAVVDTVLASRGPAGILPGALKAIRNARGIERDSVVERLASDFGVEGEDGRRTLARNYHRLETGNLLGSKLSRRLLDALAAIFDLAPAELAAAARPAKGGAPLRSVPAMGRGAGPGPPAPGRSPASGRSRTASRSRSSSRTHDARLDDPEVELVEQLFHGGPDA